MLAQTGFFYGKFIFFTLLRGKRYLCYINIMISFLFGNIFMRFLLMLIFCCIFFISLVLEICLESMSGQPLGPVQILYLHEIDILETFHMRWQVEYKFVNINLLLHLFSLFSCRHIFEILMFWWGLLANIFHEVFVHVNFLLHLSFSVFSDEWPGLRLGAELVSAWDRYLGNISYEILRHWIETC